jgi:hypothetical protein
MFIFLLYFFLFLIFQKYFIKIFSRNIKSVSLEDVIHWQWYNVVDDGIGPVICGCADIFVSWPALSSRDMTLRRRSSVPDRYSPWTFCFDGPNNQTRSWQTNFEHIDTGLVGTTWYNVTDMVHNSTVLLWFYGAFLWKHRYFPKVYCSKKYVCMLHQYITEKKCF